MNLYVGNLSFSTTEQELEAVFSEFGTVDSIKVINDRDTGRSKGFAFVEMNNNQEAKAAMADINDKEIDGRNLKVNEAKPREDRSSRSKFSENRKRW
jgi:RNA recognition motif-containing protein